jgi:hypothetical protein
LPIEVINSLDLLNDARQNHLRALIDSNQAQFRLFVALGSPPPLEQPATGPIPPAPIAPPPLPPLAANPGARAATPVVVAPPNGGPIAETARRDRAPPR